MRPNGRINLFFHCGPLVIMGIFRKQSGVSGGLLEHIDALLLDHSLSVQGKFSEGGMAMDGTDYTDRGGRSSAIDIAVHVNRRYRYAVEGSQNAGERTGSTE